MNPYGKAVLRNLVFGAIVMLISYIIVFKFL